MIDSDGFRPNVGIILTNDVGQVLWARRINQDAWQFPQGGINPRETPEEALFRELNEEVGLEEQDVKILACTRGWLRYRLPQRLVRTHSQPLCIGQKQKWFLLRLTGAEDRVRMDRTETEMVPAALDQRRRACTHGPDRQTGVRRLALGQLLVPAGTGGHLQARGLPARLKRTRSAPPGAGLTGESP